MNTHHPLTSRLLSTAVALTLALTLGACSKAETPAAGKAAGPTAAPVALSGDVAYENVAAKVKGFVAGPIMGANPVYVLFDPQCPHCAHLWQAAQPLLGKVKFVWVPVAIISPKSGPQGAAILTAPNPVQAMTEHEKLLLTQQGGIAAAPLTQANADILKANTDVLNALGADSVPFIVAKNHKTGQVVTKAGALATPMLAELIGVAP